MKRRTFLKGLFGFAVVCAIPWPEVWAREGDSFDDFPWIMRTERVSMEQIRRMYQEAQKHRIKPIVGPDGKEYYMLRTHPVYPAAYLVGLKA